MLSKNAGVRTLPPRIPGCVTLDKCFTSLSSDPRVYLVKLPSPVAVMTAQVVAYA